VSLKVPSPTRSATWRETETKLCRVCLEPMWPSPKATRSSWDRKQTCGALCQGRLSAEACRIAAGTNHYRIK
jgi:hypothetical protein